MANCTKVSGGTITILVNGAVLRRVNGDATLHLNKVTRTSVDGGGGFVTEEQASPGGEVTMTDTNTVKFTDIQQICNATITVLEPSGKIYIFTGSSFIDALDKNARAGTWTFAWVSEDYTEQLPPANAGVGLAAAA